MFRALHFLNATLLLELGAKACARLVPDPIEHHCEVDESFSAGFARRNDATFQLGALPLPTDSVKDASHDDAAAEESLDDKRTFQQSIGPES